jgi:hypothetical protein
MHRAGRFDVTYEADDKQHPQVHCHNIVTLCCKELRTDVLRVLVTTFGSKLLAVASSRWTVVGCLLSLLWQTELDILDWTTALRFVVFHDPLAIFGLEPLGRYQFKSVLAELSEIRVRRQHPPFDPGASAAIQEIAMEWIQLGALICPYPFSPGSESATMFEVYRGAQEHLRSLLPECLVDLVRRFLALPLFDILLTVDAIGRHTGLFDPYRLNTERVLEDQRLFLEDCLVKLQGPV